MTSAPPNGSLLHDPEAFALSWMDPASPAGCSITGPAPLCPHDREGRYQSLAFCGLLGARDGPFQACDEPAEARVHVENCVHDLCATGGSRQVLCEVLGSYAQQCQRHGLPVQPWRHLVDCEPACPPHSHYELCGSSCPSSCAEPALPDSCPTPCQEGCQCDAGFVLSGTDCVSPSQCGCSAGGRYHPAGEAFWAGERCERFCRCEASSHAVHCSPASCGPGQRCGNRRGIFGCHPLSPGTCHAAGHSGIITFDGRAVELPSTCASVFAESCGAPGSLPFFRVELGKENRSHSPLTLISEVSIQVNGTQVHLQRASPGMAQVNGETTALPASLAGGSLDVHWNGLSFVLLSDFGLWLSTDATYSLTLTVPRLYEGHTCGLCGSLAGAPEARDPSEQRSGSCAGDCAAACAVCEDPGQIVAARRRCWLLREPRGPFGPCHAEVDPGPYVSSCVRDLCLAEGSDRILCSALQSYAAVCQGANVTLGDWRNSSFCAPQCPQHSRYQLCLDPSQARLCIPAPLHRLGGRPGCTEGCACDDAHLWARAECVTPEQCGCVHGGRVYQVGDLVWMSRCTRRCSCDAPGHFRCSPARCPAGEICAVRGGRLGCQSPLGTCVVTGDPHYFTFDGAITHFQGTCTYRLVHSCGPEPVPGGVSFSVEASNRNFRSHLVSFLYRVEVRLSSPGLTAHVILERGQQVQVDGQVVSLPVQLGAEARVWRQQGLVLLQVGTGLQVHFNGRHTLLVRVGPEHRGRLCGLCGNFNGDPGDDKVLPSGAPARSDADFGNAWQTRDSQPGCRQDLGDTQPCQDRPRVEQLCGVLTNRSGPFAECHWHEDPGSYLHACIFDLCQYGSGNRVLCAALESYAQLCGLRGVRLPEWRTSLGCSVACPANSYYDFCGPPCPATCASLNSSAPCTRQCTAGCFCLEGFALEGGVCVPLARCGCHLQGRYLRLGAEVLPTATCDRKCVCRGPGRPLECRPHACRRRERCRQRQGVWGCHPMRYGTLWLYGDPHLHTLSGSHRQLRGPGRGALVRTCRPHHTPFAVWVEVARLEPWGASWAQQVDVDVAGWRLSLLAGQFGVVQVNGSQAHLPLTLAGGMIRAFSTSSAVTVRAATGLSVAFHESRALWVTVPDTYASALCGLGVALGTDTWEDLGGPSGSRLPEAPNVATGLGPLCPQDKAALFWAFCGLLGAQEGPYAACSRDMDPRVHVENCVHDLCATGGSRDTLCAVLGSYAQECQRRGLPLQPWRHLVACEPACPPHSHYELCGSSCPSSCAEPALPDSCPTPCQEGCQCDAGFVLSGTDCVSPSQCGCSAGGRYHPAGEAFWAGERCERFCRCEASSHAVQCSPASCGPGQRCGNRGGIFGCHPLSPGAYHAAGHSGITTADGRTTQCPGTSGFAASCAASCPQRFLQVELGRNSPGSPTVFISKLSFKANGTHTCLQTEVLSPGTTGNGCTEAQAAACTCLPISQPPSCPRSGAWEHGRHRSPPAQLGLSVSTWEARAAAQPEAVSRRGVPAVPQPRAGPSSAPSLHGRAVKPWNPK
nr:IgGFc-binding protein [Oryctolagus cuniculus]